MPFLHTLLFLFAFHNNPVLLNLLHDQLVGLFRAVVSYGCLDRFEFRNCRFRQLFWVDFLHWNVLANVEALGLFLVERLDRLSLNLDTVARILVPDDIANASPESLLNSIA